MKLKPIAITLLALAVMILCASRASADPVTVLDSDEKTLVLNSITFARDVQNSHAIVFELTFTNKTAEAKMPINEYFFTLFQGGVELQTAFLPDDKYTELSLASTTQVKNGASINYLAAYTLRDATSEVEVTVTDSLFGGHTQIFNVPLDGNPIYVPETDKSSADIASPANAASASVQDDWQAKYYDLLEKYDALQEKYNALLESRN